MNGTLGIGKIWSNTARHPFGYGNDVDGDGDDCFVEEQLDHHSITAQHGYEQKQSSLGDSDDGGACFMEE